MDDVTRQFGCQIRQLVGIHLLGRREDLMILHVGEQRLTHSVGHFEQDVAVTVRLDQLPDGKTIFQRKGFENVSDVGGVQIIELALQLGEVLPMHQTFDAVLVVAFLAMGKVFDQSVPLQQLDDLSESVLQAFLRLLGFYF